jgi:hypothetical protein
MDVEKTMQFILDQQAANTVATAELREHVKMLATTAEHLLAVQQEHETWLTALTESQTRLTEAQTRLTEAQARQTEVLNQLGEKQARNEDAINVLVRTVQDVLPRLPKQ